MYSAIFDDFSIWRDFPMFIFDKNLQLIYNHGEEITMDDLYNRYSIMEDIKTLDCKIDNKTFKYLGGINFSLYIFDNNKFRYILIGPYRFSNISIGYRQGIFVLSDSCLKYLSLLINSMVNKENASLKNSSYSPMIVRAIEYIENNYYLNLSLDDLCLNLNINKSYFCRLFKKETEYTFINYVNKFRIEKSKDFLEDKTLSLLDVAISVGFNNQSYYSTTFKKITGYSPTQYRNSLNK